MLIEGLIIFIAVLMHISFELCYRCRESAN